MAHPVKFQFISERKYEGLKMKDPDTLYYLTSGKVYHGSVLHTFIKYYINAGQFPKVGDKDFIYIDKTSKAIYYWDGKYVKLSASMSVDGLKSLEWSGNTRGEVYFIDIDDSVFEDLIIKDPNALYYLSSGLIYKGTRLLSGNLFVDSLPQFGDPKAIYILNSTKTFYIYDDINFCWIPLTGDVQVQIETALNNIKFIDGNF